jgi:hypothetical protein
MSSGHAASLPTRFRYRLSPVNMRRGLWVVAASLGLLVVLGSFASESLGETLLEDLQRQPAWALSLALIGIVTLAVLSFRIVRLASEAYLEVDSDGIRCSPHKHHGPRHWLRHDWQLPWSAIERAVVGRPGPKSQHIQGWVNTTLTLFTTQGRYDLALLLWDPVEDPLPRPDLMAFRPARPLHAMTESHPLIRHFEQRGIPVAYESLGFKGRWGMGAPPGDRPSTQGEEAPVDLMAHRSLIVMLALMGLIGLAAALHFTVLPPIRALWAPDVGMLVLTGSVIFVAGATLAGSAPLRERTVVALMLGALVGLLGHPLSVRYQSLTGPEPRVADYILDGPGQFHPVNPDLPVLDLADLEIPEYWNSLSEGSLHPFHIQKIGESRFILRFGPLFDRTRAFYRGRGEGEQASGDRSED